MYDLSPLLLYICLYISTRDVWKDPNPFERLGFEATEAESGTEARRKYVQYIQYVLWRGSVVPTGAQIVGWIDLTVSQVAFFVFNFMVWNTV